MNKRQTFFQIALITMLLLISYLVFSKPNYSMNTGIPHFDKIAHFGGFFILAWLTFEASRWRWFVIVPIMTCYALIIEFVQYHLPYRRASFADFVADLLGVACFYALIHILVKYRKYPLPHQKT